jgi:hypothetical protein
MDGDNNHDPDNYTFGCPDGTWTGRLDHKEWGKSKNLRLFFTDLATGERYTFGVFHGEKYTPKGGGPNFHTEVEPGACFTLTTGHTRTGGPKLVSAKPAS